MAIDPKTVDLITYSPAEDCYVLIISNCERWDDSDVTLSLLTEKISNYAEFALSGQLLKLYPQAANKAVRVQIDCETPPPPRFYNHTSELKDGLARYGVKLTVHLLS